MSATIGTTPPLGHIDLMAKSKKRRPTGPMTAKEYRALIEQIGLSQVAAGKFLGAHPRTSRRWASAEDEAPIPRPVALLLRYMARHKLTPEDFE